MNTNVVTELLPRDCGTGTYSPFVPNSASEAASTVPSASTEQSSEATVDNFRCQTRCTVSPDGERQLYNEATNPYSEYEASISNWLKNYRACGQAYSDCQYDCKEELVQMWLQRPARRQVDPDEIQRSAHTEGNEEYNIWYGRHLTDRLDHSNPAEREAALYRCDPARDSGFTLADTRPGVGVAYFCAFFAKGCCTKGHECLYKHRIPSRDDEGSIEWSRDVFGRERHRDHRDDMGGVGSFNHECKTLFVGGLHIDPLEEDCLKKLEAFLWDTFGLWGDVKSVRVIPKKLFGFVTYHYRVQAEFAKVAMADQPAGKYGAVLSVKWAHQDTNKRKEEHSGPEVQKKRQTDQINGWGSNCTHDAATRGEQTIENTLQSYCAAWTNYWAVRWRCSENQGRQVDKLACDGKKETTRFTDVIFTSESNAHGAGRRPLYTEDTIGQHITDQGCGTPQFESTSVEQANIQRMLKILARVDDQSGSLSHEHQVSFTPHI